MDFVSGEETRKLFNTKRKMSVPVDGEPGMRLVGFVVSDEDFAHFFDSVRALDGLVDHWKATHSQSSAEEDCRSDTERPASGERSLTHLRSENASLRSRIAKLEARLEIDHAYQWQGEGEELVRIEIPPEERSTFPDGITARDATIKLQDERIERLRSRIERLREAIEPFATAEDPEDSDGEIVPRDDEDLFDAISSANIKFGDLRRARSIYQEAAPEAEPRESVKKADEIPDRQS
jgi:hypothetical protein